MCLFLLWEVQLLLFLRGIAERPGRQRPPPPPTRRQPERSLLRSNHSTLGSEPGIGNGLFCPLSYSRSGDVA